MRTVLALILPLLLVAVAYAQAPSRPAEPEPPPTVVQHEMQLLTRALETTVQGIGKGDVRPVAAALHQVHGAKEATSRALASGTYRLPRHPEELAAFQALDEAFHAELVPLVKAARKNDVPAAAEALGQVMKQCHGCHARYRDP